LLIPPAICWLANPLGLLIVRFRETLPTDRCWPTLVGQEATFIDRNRGRPVSNLSTAIVSNTEGMPPIERPLYGTSTVKIFPLP